MKRWQRLWLYFNIVFFSIHLVRDLFQDFGVVNLLSTFLASTGPPKVPLFIYYTLYNTYIIAVMEIIFSIICLKRNKFGRLGNSTIIVVISLLILWVVYYFFL